ncbi:hypothetical protein LG201_11645 [Methylobacillus gramineus]|uniref:hypothetical protein n=1 Tax=Methylobacillus gramineus TaxID=755169 RepID=UPI001CFFFF6A|nr:hypothetical protein [Methylobacillus gramineus]MCB5185856.1 hypothetical protein [Methylobacillus gramineus]
MKKSITHSLPALLLVLMTGTMSITSAYADRDDREDRRDRHEQRGDRGRGHDHGQWEKRGRDRHDDRRWNHRQAARPVIIQQDVHYHFRDDDRYRLRHQYDRSLRMVNRDHRPYFQAGYAVLPAYRPYITPVPVQVLHRLPPPPPGYVIGYYQGYNVVYDPVSFVVLTTIDLLR